MADPWVLLTDQAEQALISLCCQWWWWPGNASLPPLSISQSWYSSNLLVQLVVAGFGSVNVCREVLGAASSQG